MYNRQQKLIFIYILYNNHTLKCCEEVFTNKKQNKMGKISQKNRITEMTWGR